MMPGSNDALVDPFAMPELPPRYRTRPSIADLPKRGPKVLHRTLPMWARERTDTGVVYRVYSGHRFGGCVFTARTFPPGMPRGEVARQVAEMRRVTRRPDGRDVPAPAEVAAPVAPIAPAEVAAPLEAVQAEPEPVVAAPDTTPEAEPAPKKRRGRDYGPKPAQLALF